MEPSLLHLYRSVGLKVELELDRGRYVWMMIMHNELDYSSVTILSLITILGHKKLLSMRCSAAAFQPDLSRPQRGTVRLRDQRHRKGDLLTRTACDLDIG